MISDTLKAATENSHGWHAGNYANAYTSETLDPASWEGRSSAYRAAYLLGFYASYEAHEIPPEWRDEVEALRVTEDA